jgi:hypothetical protein
MSFLNAGSRDFFGIQGNRAVVLGSSQYWGPGTAGLAGNVVVAVLDLTNPQAPTVLSSQILDLTSNGVSLLQSLGSGTYVASYSATVPGHVNQSALLLLDTSQRQGVDASVVNMPSALRPDGYTGSGNELFTEDGSNLHVYNIGQLEETPVTVRVAVPTTGGVALVAGSFNVPPTSNTMNTDSETIEWDLAFAAGNTSDTLTWQTNITGLQTEETTTVAQDGTVSFVSQGTP